MRSGEQSRAEVIGSFAGVVEKLRSIKKRSADLRSEEKDLLRLLKKRIDHLKEHEAAGSTVAAKGFRKTRFDRVLIDYFLRSGFYETAQLLADKSAIQVGNFEPSGEA